jgi:hypothetical protein
MDFAEALRALKAGHKVARQGWNGKGMWLVLVPGSRVELRPGTTYHMALNDERFGQSHATINPHIDMFTAQGQMQPGWFASQTDMLAEDWVSVGPLVPRPGCSGAAPGIGCSGAAPGI